MASVVNVQGECRRHPDNILEQNWPYWWLVYVRPQQDQKILQDLAQRDVASLAFFEKRVRKYDGKGSQTGYVPLLAGYVFVAAKSEDVQDAIFETGRALTINRVEDVPALLADIHGLMGLLDRNADKKIYVNPGIVEGAVVCLESGVMAGKTGVVVRRKGVSFLVVNMRLLGQSVSVEIDAASASVLSDE